MSVLHKIIVDKRAEVARTKARLPPHVLRSLAETCAPPKNFTASLLAHAAPRIIAEVKRASPSRGVLRPNAPVGEWDPVQLATHFAKGGAACLSVLTEVKWFWGHPDHLAACGTATGLPVLRKDFIVDVYQVDESRWLGADAVLLIVGILDDATLHAAAARAAELGMAALIEVHSEQELARALTVPKAIVGINHRDLHSFAVDMHRATRLRPLIPPERPVIAESGLRTAGDLQRLAAAGVDGFLVGETIASADDPEQALRELRQ